MEHGREGILSWIRESMFSLDQLTKRYPELEILKGVPQNPEYHGEGDVYIHTGLVCEQLCSLSEWAGLTDREQEGLFLAAAFHDIGKPAKVRGGQVDLSQTYHCGGKGVSGYGISGRKGIWDDLSGAGAGR